MCHGFVGPRGSLVGVAEDAWVGDLVLLGHRWSDYAESVRVHHGAGNTFGLNLRHVASNALASRAAVFVVSVRGQGRCVRSVRRGRAVAVKTDLIGGLA